MSGSSNLQAFSFFFLCVSVFFWAWALKNTLGMKGAWDLGLVSFLSVALTSSYVMGLTNRGLMPTSGLTKALVTGSHLLVTFNYAIGVYFGYYVLKRSSFAIYCIIFTFIWAGVAWYGSVLMGKSGDSGTYSTEESILL